MIDDDAIYSFFQSIAVNRLGAAHRGTLRALQVVIHQLSDISGGKLPPSYVELGKLIRQLCSCSAKVEAENGSVVPDVVLSILQILEVRCNTYGKKAFGYVSFCCLLFIFFFFAFFSINHSTAVIVIKLNA